jgi:chemotaxis family two-component system sensor kinase Cph1
LSTIQESMEFQLKQAAATVRVSDLPGCLGDATQMNQVFSNLLDNALKYLDSKRRPVIQVSGRIEDGRAIYTVKDNGIGIAREHQGKVFEIFHRLDPSRGQGEGLGLTIAQRILERQNGKIWVESQAGKGSAFFVSIPAES